MNWRECEALGAIKFLAKEIDVAADNRARHKINAVEGARVVVANVLADGMRNG